MTRKPYIAEQIIEMLREADVGLSQGEGWPDLPGAEHLGAELLSLVA